MIQDYQTNMVYLAEGLKYYKPVYTNLLRALEKEGIPYSFLPRTQSKKHIWARDYMPRLEGTCSECGERQAEEIYGNACDFDLGKFCKNCGARMVEPQEREDKE